MYTQTVAIWRDIVGQGETTSAEIDVPSWLSRTALDMLGAGVSFHSSLNIV